MYEIDFDDVGLIIIENCVYYDTFYSDDTYDLNSKSWDLHFFDFPNDNEGNLYALHKDYQHCSQLRSSLLCPKPLLYFLWEGQPMKLKDEK